MSDPNEPYRKSPSPTPRRPWLLPWDRWWFPMRRRRWFRRAVGGVWTLRVAMLIPGCPEWWHCEGADAETRSSFSVLAREEWS